MASVRLISLGGLRKPFQKKHLRGWRVFSLIAIHVLFAVHVLHWKLHGRTLAPMEFSESLHTLHDGVLTVGFLFTVLALLGTLVFGRFFCGWGCHILALQDSCAWLLGKFGIKPKPVRTRFLAWIPVAIFGYIYLWPQVSRILKGIAQPAFSIQQDADGWASFVTSDLFRAMPSWIFSILTLLVCGFLIVYFLGSRSFCYSVCPYGVFFSAADKISPGARLVLSSGCESCGLCTLNCKSGVQVIQELKKFGTVTDSNCLKSLDCVAGCPSGAIGLGWKSPLGLKNKTRPGSSARAVRKSKHYDMTFREECAALFVIVVLMTIYRGLYEIGLFMAAAIAVIGAIVAVRGWRWAVTFRRSRAPEAPSTRSGPRVSWMQFIAAFGSGLAFFALSVHGALVHYHVYRGYALFDSRENPEACASHLRWACDWGLFPNSKTEKDLASVYVALKEFGAARDFYGQYLRSYPTDIEARVGLGNVWADAGEPDSAFHQYSAAIMPDSLLHRPTDRVWRATAHSLTARWLALHGDTTEALEHLRSALVDDPADVSHSCNYVYLSIRHGDLEPARTVLVDAEGRLGPAPCLRGLAQLLR